VKSAKRVGQNSDWDAAAEVATAERRRDERFMVVQLCG